MPVADDMTADEAESWISTFSIPEEREILESRGELDDTMDWLYRLAVQHNLDVPEWLEYHHEDAAKEYSQ